MALGTGSWDWLLGLALGTGSGVFFPGTFSLRLFPIVSRETVGKKSQGLESQGLESQGKSPWDFVPGKKNRSPWDFLGIPDTVTAPGPSSLGLLSLGLFSLGLFSLGLFSLGLFSLGLLSLGLFSWRESGQSPWDFHQKVPGT